MVGGVWYKTSIVRRSPSAGALTQGVKFMIRRLSEASWNRPKA